MLNDTDRARDALHSIPADLPRDGWVKAGMAAHAAGLSFDDFDSWSAQAGNYNGQACKSTWRSFKAAPGGITAGALFGMARDHGWNDDNAPRPAPAQTTTRTPEPQRKPLPGLSASELFGRCEPATASHSYAVRKQLCEAALTQLRMVPENDALAHYRGWLAVPGYSIDGALQTIEFVSPEAGVNKMTLKGSQKSGAMFSVGPDTGPIVIVEGLATASAVFASTGWRAISTFGSGNTRRVAESLRQKEPEARIILAPDRGKESDAQKIAAEFNCAVACVPACEPNNADLNDIFIRDGFDVLAALLESATEPTRPEPRYKLLGSADLHALPPLAWRIRGVLPAVGLAGLYGPSASGKSFLALDAACAISEGSNWFNCRVEAAPVIYLALEGESGFKLRAQAWEAHKGRALPDDLHMILQDFKLTDPRDISDLASVVPAGAVVFIDTLNRAAPTADENSSRDMGEILEGAKRLQSLIGGLVVLVHHTGKNTAAGLRGHSSLFAALDAAIEVSRDGDRREWRCAKSKDGADGDAHTFRLQIETLGTDGYGDAVTSCVVAVDHAPQAIRAKLAGGSNQRLILDALRPLFKTGQTGKAGAPPLRTCIELEDALTVAASRLITVEEKRKPERAKRAIQDLVAKGLIGFSEGWLWLI